MTKNRMGLSVLLGTALLVSTGCQDLDIVNTNQPDRARALTDPGDVQALIAGTFGVMFTALHNTAHITNLFPVYAAEFTGVPVSGGGWSQSLEPRGAYENSASIPGDSGPWGPRTLWALLSQAVSNANDGLATLEEGDLTIRENGVDVTPRARAFAKLIQGWAWGYMALMYDQAVAVPETVTPSADPFAQAVENIRPASEVFAMALASIDEAISIAQQNPFTLPAESGSRLFFATLDPMTSAQFIRLANTLAARMHVLNARTPAQRANVDWAKVLQYTSNGLNTDFGVVLASGFRSSLLYTRAQTNSAGCANCYRWDNRLIGMADTSGNFQTWLNTPLDTRTKFLITTPDRRITGATPTSNGAYTAYLANDNGFPAGRGDYFRSSYQWARHARRGFQANSGTAIFVYAAENDLLRAEALIRTGGNLDQAAQLINNSRTRVQTISGVAQPTLPPVTAAGVPAGANCTPRTEAGACGTLMTALRYERLIELAASDAIRGYLDSRGFGMLPDGSWLQAPMPGNEMDVIGQPIYTFGGVGTEWGAVYAPSN